MKAAARFGTHVGRSPLTRLVGAIGLVGVAVLVGVAGLAGCTTTARGGNGAVGSSVPGSTASSPVPSRATGPASATAPLTPASDPAPSPQSAVVTVVVTRSGQTVTAGPPPSTAEPAATPGDCPYLSADTVTFITGQHHGQTRLVNLVPHPMCVFYRSDGGWLGSVRVIQAANPLEAVAAVNQHAPIADSQAASQPAGWSGGSMITPGQMTQDSDGKAVYAVSKGNIAVVAEENENRSIKPRLLAVCAIYGLKLQTGQAPSACSGAEG